MLEYKQWLILSEELNTIVDERSELLNTKYKEHKTASGLIPFEITNSDEYKKDKARFNKAFSNLREFNQVSPKEYLKKKSKDKRGY